MSNPITELFSLPIEKNEIGFIYFGFSGVILKTKDNTIAIDMCKICLDSEDQIKALKNLDLQLNTHGHRDHFDLETTASIFKVSGAKVIADPQVAKELEKEIPVDKLKSLIKGEKLSIDGIEISSVSGVHPGSITLFKMKWPEFSIFHGGDSGYIPLKKYHADLAFLPTGAPSPSCSPENALKMALDVTPKVIVTMHGNQDQMEKFKTLARKEMPGLNVIIPKIKEPMKIKI
ncbi:MAG: MBL fold metallo-hydrolase [Candidatus Heimdallarchaeota archaeon]|nr:MAG: MBL fold metallo-hydrolase [Candidatus Heimdallarchaeota archaeon]